jgi:Leucine-rich repeat (LRR) protein
MCFTLHSTSTSPCVSADQLSAYSVIREYDRFLMVREIVIRELPLPLFGSILSKPANTFLQNNQLTDIPQPPLSNGSDTSLISLHGGSQPFLHEG